MVFTAFVPLERAVLLPGFRGHHIRWATLVLHEEFAEVNAQDAEDEELEASQAKHTGNDRGPAQRNVNAHACHHYDIHEVKRSQGDGDETKRDGKIKGGVWNNPQCRSWPMRTSFSR